MPSFSTQIATHNDGSRPIAPVLIGDAGRYTIEDLQKSKELKFERFDGLIDTGATITCVTRTLADQLNLTLFGTRPMTSASERNVESNVYRLVVMVAALSQETSGPIPMSYPLVVEACEFINSGKGDVDVIIGMDIIKTSVLIINGHDHRITMSF